LGTLGNDSLVGGADTDLLDYSNTSLAVTVNLSPSTGPGTSTGAFGNDSLSGFESIVTGTGNDSITGASGAAETINAGAGDDSFGGSTGNDSLFGGAGNNLLDFSNTTASVTINLATGTSTGAFNNDSFTGFTGVVTGSGADSLRGSAGNDSLSGGAGADTLVGGNGADSISAGNDADEIRWDRFEGNDTIDGGDGNDILRISTRDFTPASLPTGGNAGPAPGLNGWERISGITYNSPEGATYRYTPTGETLTIRNIETVTICFYPGTMIATPNGERAVETLAIGDMVLTAEGDVRPIRWMGRQTVSTLFGDPLRVLPVRILAGALGEGVPARDLLLSPDHAVLVEGILVQAGALVNGTTILRQFDVPEVFTYHHIELQAHELVLAEGAPAETFVDNIDRLGFDNWEEHEALYGCEPSIPEMDRPRAKAQRQVPRFVQHAIEARAGMKLIA
ncbi:Hint domain-containing protein, partial [Plastoroseomonas arctica]